MTTKIRVIKYPTITINVSIIKYIDPHYDAMCSAQKSSLPFNKRRHFSAFFVFHFLSFYSFIHQLRCSSQLDSTPSCCYFGYGFPYFVQFSEHFLLQFPSFPCKNVKKKSISKVNPYINSMNESLDFDNYSRLTRQRNLL